MLLVAPRVLATDRLMRRFDATNGFELTSAYTLAQDREGFIWIGSTSGCYRFDGFETRRVTMRGCAVLQGTAQHGELLIQLEGGIAELHGLSAEPILGSDGQPLHGVLDAARDLAGGIWFVKSDALLYRDAAGAWHDFTFPIQSDDQRWSVITDPRGGVVLRARFGIHHVDTAGRHRLISTARYTADLEIRPDGSLVAISNWPQRRAFEIRDGVERTLFVPPEMRAISIALDGPRVWFGFDGGVAVVQPDGSSEVIETNRSLTSGGPLLVDREGSLWIGTFNGLVQIPQPNTVTWSPASSVVRRLARRSDRLFLWDWKALYALSPAAPNGVLSHLEHSFGAACTNDDDTTLVFGAIETNISGTRTTKRRPARPVGDVYRCTAAGSGGRWIPAGTRLLRWRTRETWPTEIRGLPRNVDPNDSAGSYWPAVFEDQQGELWLGGANRICHARARAVEREDSPAWHCDELPDVGLIQDFAPLPDGSLLATATEAGSLRHDGNGWVRSPLSSLIPGGWWGSMQLSPRGGLWLTGTSAIVRVDAHAAAQGRAEILESVGTWDGLTTLNAMDLLEDPDGTLWVGTDTGLAMVPASVRDAPRAVPDVIVTDVLVDGQRLPVDRRFELPFRRNRLELRYVGLSFKDPSLVRYRVRIGPNDPWAPPTRDRSVRFVDLAAGDYDVEVAASLDNEHWTVAPAKISFRVLRPWYLQTWFALGVLMLTSGLTYLMYRMRVSRLLSLERQRTQIAMDLHDEIGSGLGSIGIMAGVGLRGDQAQSGPVLEYIANTSRELSAALGDIVWSLRPGTANLAALAAQIESRARPLFAAGPKFETEFPESWPDVPLALPVQRSVLLIALEALHNAARHADASTVTLSITPHDGRWRLTVQDDGRGIPAIPQAGARRGLGLEAMRSRAASIGAALTCESALPAGTRLQLEFRAQGKGG